VLGSPLRGAGPGNGGPRTWEVEHGAKGEKVSRTGSQCRGSTRVTQ